MIILMEILIAAMSVLSLLTVAAYVMMMNMKKQVERGNKLRLIPAILIMGVCMIASGIPVRYSSASRLMLDLTAVAAPLLAMSFSVNLMHNPKPIFYLSVFMDSILITMHLMSFAGIIPPTPSGVFIIFVSAFIIGASAFFFLCILYHVRNVSLIMKRRNVTDVMGMFEDFSYIMAMMASLAAFNYFCSSAHGKFVVLLLDLLMLVSICTLVCRLSRSGIFTFMASQETLILESIKSETIGLRFEPSAEEDDNRMMYKKLTAYFEEEQPYLNNELNINDVARAMGSNKTYVSKTISLCTGRNFRQFVNYYRIRHSIALFNENPSLKIVNIYCQCGFNSLASFNMAFRLFMKENPSEWFRKERATMRNSLADKD